MWRSFRVQGCFDVEPVAEQLPQAAVSVAQANAVTGTRLQPGACLPAVGVHARAVIVHGNAHRRSVPCDMEADPSAPAPGERPVCDGVFDERLDRQRWHLDGSVRSELFIDVPLHGEAVAEPFRLNVQVRAHEIEFVLQRHQAREVFEVETSLQVIAKRREQGLHALWIDFTQRGDGIERIEQEVRLNLRLQHRRLQPESVAGRFRQVGERGDAGAQFERIDRFRYKVVRSGPKSCVEVVRLRPCRQYQHRSSATENRSRMRRVSS